MKSGTIEGLSERRMVERRGERKEEIMTEDGMYGMCLPSTLKQEELERSCESSRTFGSLWERSV